MAANPNDHALIFGIRRYFGTAAGWPTDLQGPDNDAAAVAGWLRKPTGGGLPAENVQVLCSADAPDPFQNGRGLPDQETVIGVLKQVTQLPKKYKDENKRQFVGRRLYVYVSGHGWANRRLQAALVTAEAAKDRTPNVDITSWTDFLAEAGAFKEIVLWADTCATRMGSAVIGGTPGASGLRPVAHPNAPHVNVFAGFASGIGLRAVENLMPDGNWHGAFTYALLRALEGDAVTPVTSNSLSDYLRNAMKQFQSPTDQDRPVVSHEPTFGSLDPITFATPARQTVQLTITFPPACVGHLATVSRGRNKPPLETTTLTETTWRVALEPGLYVVLVDTLSVSQAFEAVGDGGVTVNGG